MARLNSSTSEKAVSALIEVAVFDACV